jgi:hypothetical protein
VKIEGSEDSGGEGLVAFKVEVPSGSSAHGDMPFSEVNCFGFGFQQHCLQRWF